MNNKIILLISLLLCNNYCRAQKSDLTNFALGTSFGIGLSALLLNTENAQNFLESKMLDYLLINENIELPQTISVRLVNKSSNKQDYIKANSYIFNVRGNLFGNFIYVMAIGTKKFDLENEFDFRRLTYLKYDKAQWEKCGIEIINSLSNNTENFSSNQFIAQNLDLKLDTVSFFNLKKIKDESFVFAKEKYYPYGEKYFIETYLQKKKIAENNHLLFHISTDLNHQDQKIIFDYSELGMNFFIPSIQESILISNREFIQISESLRD